MIPQKRKPQGKAATGAAEHSTAAKQTHHADRAAARPDEESKATGAAVAPPVKRQLAPAPASAAAAAGDSSAGTGAGAGPAAQKRRTEAPKAIDGDEGEHGRAYTVSVALPGSIIDHFQTAELRAYAAGAIGRALAIFCVDEVVIYHELAGAATGGASGGERKREDWNPDHFLARLLQHSETPPYLRRQLIPQHPDLRFAGLMPPLETPHHMRVDDIVQFREGVVVEGKSVNVGLRREIQIDREIPAGVRLTVELDAAGYGAKKQQGRAVAPSKPRETLGTYWGYTVRLADGLSQVLTEAPFEGGYDLTIGTSENATATVDDADFKLKPFKHLLIVFGGVMGLEETAEADEHMNMRREDVPALFDMWLNTCPGQGSRSIRTEEAIPISLSILGSHIRRNQSSTQ